MSERECRWCGAGTPGNGTEHWSGYRVLELEQRIAELEAEKISLQREVSHLEAALVIAYPQPALDGKEGAP